MLESRAVRERGGGAERRRSAFFRRFVYVYLVLLALLLLALLPPLVNVNRFQRRIATSIGESLGRPVHLDSVSLTVLPLPGFTLVNLVVAEDPGFGSEPVIRANEVQATLRLQSLWGRRVEFSTITFKEPSVNLVHRADGKWNLEGILLQASRIQAAPTAQAKAGPAPRFPYIEATGARVNLKQGMEKLPIALTEADFALWLPSPQEWRLRLQGHPARTDTNASDTGIFQMEGTLGHAGSLLEVPINLSGEWRNAPLGEASRVVMGRDMGLRGQVTVSATVKGTVGESAVTAKLKLGDARRAEFVPERALNVEMECLGDATEAFHTFEEVRCSWPPAGATGLLGGAGPQMLAVLGSVPDVRRMGLATVEVGSPGVPAGTLVDWLRIASARVPADLTAAGTMSASFTYEHGWTGRLAGTGVSLSSTRAGLSVLTLGEVGLQSVAAVKASSKRGHVVEAVPAGGFVLAPVLLALGDVSPALLEGRFDGAGYTLHLTGMAEFSKLLALGAAVPQFGDGLAEALPKDRAKGPTRVDLTATRSWGGGQVWREGAVKVVVGKGRRK